MDLLEGLNPAQRKAVESINGPLLIVAGPGSGKTRVITHRIAYLVKTCGVSPRRIMAVTFTNKAAKEMKERLRRLLGDVADDLSMGTFHSLCARILRIEAEHAGLEKAFAIYDADDQASLIRRSMKDVEVDSKKFSVGAIANAISAAKANLLRPEEFAMQKAAYFDEIVLRVYERYQALLGHSNAVDFDDLLMKTVRMFRAHPDVLEKYQERYVHVMIDEFQDTSHVQYEFAAKLAGKHRNLCAVGDPDQSIYSWRFAEVRNILDFERDYPGAMVILLEQNYRSTQNILDAASGLISPNKDRKETKLWTENNRGVPVTLHEALNESDEAVYIINEVQRLAKTGAKHGDCAVLYRTNAQSRPIEEAFLRYGLPYRLVGATRFYERREVKDMLAYLRLVANPFDDVSLLRVVNVPARGIGQRTLDELTAWASAHGLPLHTAAQILGEKEVAQGDAHPDIAPRIAKSLIGFVELIDRISDLAKEGTLPDLFDLLLEQTGYRDYVLAEDDRGEERIDNIKEMSSVAVEFAHMELAEALTAYLEQVALVSDTDNLDQRANSVTLITLHQAKGLEFPYVFMVGVEEGLLPHQRSINDQDKASIEEERRLAYVGVTRAEKGLFLVRAHRRVAMGQFSQNRASRFLDDIPPQVLAQPLRIPARPRADAWGPPSGSAQRERQAASGPAPFRAGDRVRHGSFGDGVVISCAPADSDYQITVAFRGTAGIKKLSNTYANLQKA